jgi:hypothetical protein
MILRCRASDGISQKVILKDILIHRHSILYVHPCFYKGGFSEFGLMECLGEGRKPTAIIGEVADKLELDLVVLSMEAIHSKHVDGNLLSEFIPCSVLLLPL